MAQYNAGPQNVQFYPPGQEQIATGQHAVMHANPNVQPGLEHLYGASKFVVKQKKDMAEVFVGWEMNNRYEIYNEAGQLVYFAAEDTSGWSLCFFGNARPFTLRIFDGNRSQIMVLNANVDCCNQTITVEVPAGRMMATIDKEFAFFTPSFFIKDTSGRLMFKIKSPIAASFGSFGDVKFDILSADEKTVVGQISKQWGGFFREGFTNADTFGISLPPDMDAEWKAVLLGCLFHIDFTFYEQRNR